VYQVIEKKFALHWFPPQVHKNFTIAARLSWGRRANAKTTWNLHTPLFFCIALTHDNSNHRFELSTDLQLVNPDYALGGAPSLFFGHFKNLSHLLISPHTHIDNLKLFFALPSPSIDFWTWRGRLSFASCLLRALSWLLAFLRLYFGGFRKAAEISSSYDFRCRWEDQRFSSWERLNSK
jgi:hypothetical protein